MGSADTRFLDAYNRFQPHVYAYCRRRTTAEMVDDAVADTFLTAWQKSHAIPPGDEALPWLYGVAYRVLTHQWRSASRRSRLSGKLASLGATAINLPEDVMVMRQESRQLLSALGTLKRTDQEILRLTAWEELTGAEIATVLGLSPGAARQRLYSAKKKLADEYNRLENRRPAPPLPRKEERGDNGGAGDEAVDRVEPGPRPFRPRRGRCPAHRARRRARQEELSDERTQEEEATESV